MALFVYRKWLKPADYWETNIGDLAAIYELAIDAERNQQ